MGRPFKNVEQMSVGRSVFDLSYSKLMSANMGLLYPIMVDEVVPGDHFTIGHSIVARVMPLVAPILHEINVTVHCFFVPTRLLWEDWEDFISGGPDGTDASVPPRMSYPASFDGSLWDYLGFPELPSGVLSATDTLPLDFAKRAYNKIWNEYYRDENLQAEVVEDTSDILLRRAWTKDYFTSALPWAQRGIAPAFPITGAAPLSGNSPIAWSGFSFADLNNGVAFDRTTDFSASGSEVGLNSPFTTAENAWNAAINMPTFADNSGVTANLSAATTFDVNTLRTAWQIQKWMERNARAGVRYTEFLHAHYGVSPKDDRLQRAEYIGGMKCPVIISEVLQTSATVAGQTPQGNLAGHGITVAQEYCGKYFVQEYGYIMSILSITPKPMYSQGLNRQWTRRTKYDWYFPEFANLGEQAVEDQEIYWQASDALNKHVFGFQGRYDEMRYKPNITVGDLRPGKAFDYWTLTREFGSLPALDDTFITCDPDPRSWAVQVGAPQFVIHVGNHIKAIRPLPALGTPGLVDHH